MGVFARLFRRSKAAEEASTAEEQADAAAGSEAARGEADVSAGAEGGAAEATKADDGAEDTGADGVEIPRQQSAEEAAEPEAGEGART
ncbi:hypothetical protein ABZV31_34555 [Streptomyces sp. NPDC005202]|uniref:hypothetical protein n=1 Tax=Streptomyces sp. NPDC005202 TaxID=3157021 RepID=UPI0033A1E88C